jgi:predicted dehydrogenase
MNAKPIRIGVIGAGANTQKMHLPLLQAIPGVQITDVANRTLESGQKIASEYHIPRVHSNWEAIATADDIDAVVIGTWPYLHCPATMMSLAHNKHVLCEARMAMNKEEALQMLQASQDAPHLIAQLVPAPFTLRADDTVKQVIASNQLGKISHIQTEFQTAPVSRADEPLHWRRNKIFSGENIMTLGIIYETLLRWLPPALWVSAQSKCFNDRALSSDSSTIQIEIPDYLNVQMQLGNGAQASMIFSELAPTARPPHIEIFGNKAALRLELLPSVKLFTAQNSDKIWEEMALPDMKNNGWRVEEEFIRSIRNQTSPHLTTFKEGLEYMKFTSAVNRSLQEEGKRTFV